VAKDINLGTRICVLYDPENEDPEGEWGCEKEFVSSNPDRLYCNRCLANHSYWERREKKRPGALRRYRAIVGGRSTRLAEWAGVTTHTNVIPMKRKRNRA
jgi:hypothetical protein